MQYLFGDDYLLDPERRELRKAGALVAIGPQVFDLLLQLIRHRERVVSKDELLATVWSGRIVSESTITSHLNAVRKAVGDSGEQQRLVKTIPRKGFRFVGELRELDAPAAAPEPPSAQPSALRPALALPAKPSIAVLPFHNLSGDAAQDYFADGVVEDIVGALSRMRWLFVIARNSSFSYKGRAVDAATVGRELGVRYVLEGSLRKTGDKVRVTGQLVDATSGEQLWAERFEGSLGDLFALQDQLAESVVGAIAPQLERAEIERAKRQPIASLDAFDDYLRGLARLRVGSREAIPAALPLFRRATALDPEFGAA